MGAVADEFLDDGRDEGGRFGVVEAEAAGEAALGEVPEVGGEEFVELGVLVFFSVFFCSGVGVLL